MEAERREDCRTRFSRPRCRTEVEKEVKIVKLTFPAKNVNFKVRSKQEAAEKRRLEAQKEKRQINKFYSKNHLLLMGQLISV